MPLKFVVFQLSDQVQTQKEEALEIMRYVFWVTSFRNLSGLWKLWSEHVH